MYKSRVKVGSGCVVVGLDQTEAELGWIELGRTEVKEVVPGKIVCFLVAVPVIMATRRGNDTGKEITEFSKLRVMLVNFSEDSVRPLIQADMKHVVASCVMGITTMHTGDETEGVMRATSGEQKAMSIGHWLYHQPGRI